MLKIIIGIFFVLHGLVHLFYFGQSRRLFDLRPDMVWPDGSWAFSKLLGDKRTRLLASICCILAAIGFVIGGIGFLFGGDWWRSLVVGSSVFSAAVFVLFWDGKMQHLAEKGGIGVIINIAILIAVLTIW